MTPEDRLKHALVASAHDPGPKQEWDGFIRTAHRDRFVHRAVVVGAAFLMMAFVTLGISVMDNLFDRAAPSPADKNERTERKHDERVDKTDDPVRKNEKKAEEARIVPGPRKEADDDQPRNVAVVDTDREADVDPPPEKPGEVQPVSATCGGQTATIVGTDKNDVLNGTSGRDVIVASDGDDEIRAGDGDDILCGGAGFDELHGGPGRDGILAGSGDDRIDGGEGFDFVHFPAAPLHVYVNLEQGYIEGEGRDKVARVEGAEGTGYNDTLTGNGVANVLIGGGGNDGLYGTGGDDILVPGPGDDTLNGMQHSDTVDFSSSGAGIELDLTVRTHNEGSIATGQGSDRLHGVENIIGSGHGDVISGNRDRNTLSGGPGNDSLSGDGQTDVLLGREGDDSLDGGPDNDELDGGPGTDTCTGEAKKSCERKGPAGALLILGALGQLLLSVARRRSRPRSAARSS